MIESYTIRGYIWLAINATAFVVFVWSLCRNGLSIIEATRERRWIFVSGLGLMLFSFLYRSLVAVYASKGDFSVSFIPITEMDEKLYHLLHNTIYEILLAVSMVTISVSLSLSAITANSDRGQ